MEATNEVGLVILGAAGYRGQSALEILPKLRTAVTTKGISLELVSAAEAKQDLRADLGAKVVALLGYPCPVVGMLAEAIAPALRWLASGRVQRKLIVYDATPTAHHYLHLMVVLPHSAREQIYYFGEKPLFTEPGQVQFVEQNFAGQTFFCELIETENPAVRAASDFIRSQGVAIQRMSFWRASCVGVPIAAGDGRGGVEGGALVDKTPHDLSVSLALMGLGSMKGWSIRQARTYLVALHEDAFRLNRRSFLSVANTSIEDLGSPARIPEQLPAGALLSFECDFTLHDNTVIPVSYLASWVGVQDVEPELVLSGKLAALGIATAEWVDRQEPQQSRNPQYRYTGEEVRVCLVEGVVRKRRVHLVLNLLAKFQGRRFVYLFGEDRQREIIFEEEDGRDYRERKAADFLGVFQRVVEHCAGQASADNVAAPASLLVHKIMLSALAKANEKLRSVDQDEAFRASVEAYRKYLVTVENSRQPNVPT